MPGFMYTIILFSSVMWYITFSYLRSNDPEDGFLTVLIFLILFLVTLTATLSIPAYFIVQSKAPNFSNLRFMFRKGLRWAFYLSFGITFYLGMAAFKLNNIINTVLFLLLYILTFFQLRTRR